MMHFRIFDPSDLSNYINSREGETKLGEGIECSLVAGDWRQQLLSSPAKFVLLGIVEDAGVRANLGIGGAGSAWQPFLRAFLNLQHNSYLRGEDIFLLGNIELEEATDDLMALRQQVSELDELVTPIVESIIAAGKIPLVIGGGHNNAFPLLKGASLAFKSKVNAVNLDAHSDFRREEGRHSGNGFRYAYQAGYLEKYAMLGLHENYNSEVVLSDMAGLPDLLPIFWENIFLRRLQTWEESVEAVLWHVCQQPFGVELDTDSIENVLSSALTPVGVTTQQALYYLYKAGSNMQSCYLHLPEAVATRADGQVSATAGKLLSYLVQSFIKGVNDREQP